MKKGDKVNTPEGIGTVETADEHTVSGTLENGQAFAFNPRYVTLVEKQA
mgnify:CR=1 FL=1